MRDAVIFVLERFHLIPAPPLDDFSGAPPPPGPASAPVDRLPEMPALRPLLPSPLPSAGMATGSESDFGRGASWMLSVRTYLTDDAPAASAGGPGQGPGGAAGGGGGGGATGGGGGGVVAGGGGAATAAAVAAAAPGGGAAAAAAAAAYGARPAPEKMLEAVEELARIRDVELAGIFNFVAIDRKFMDPRLELLNAAAQAAPVLGNKQTLGGSKYGGGGGGI